MAGTTLFSDLKFTTKEISAAIAIVWLGSTAVNSIKEDIHTLKEDVKTIKARLSIGNEIVESRPASKKNIPFPVPDHLAVLTALPKSPNDPRNIPGEDE